MFSIAGIPPMIGFLAKMGVFFIVIRNGIDQNWIDPFDTSAISDPEFTSIDLYHVEFFVIAVLAILCSVVSTFYYIRVIKILYFENTLVGKLYYPINNQKILILSFLVFLLIFLFVNPTFLYLIIHYVAKSLTYYSLPNVSHFF